MNSADNLSHSEIKPRRSFWLPLLCAGLLTAAGATVYEGRQTADLRQRVAASQKDNEELRAQLSGTDAELRNAFDSLRADVEKTREETSASLANSQNSAALHADAVAVRLQRKEEEQTRQIADELTRVKESSQESASRLDDRIEGITSQVGTVKTDVDAAKTDLQDTKSELQRARGDLGTMSGLIATNSKEIQQLRDLGDRNIFEFNLAKSAGTQRVGDIQVVLRRVDAKHNRYSLDVLADDKRVEKKDRTVNEPVQFYREGARQPYELVVNKVDKDRIVGYLATPKVTVSRNEPPAGR
jgi:DNA repair exonuclease SbcCD ATPase subunit